MYRMWFCKQEETHASWLYRKHQDFATVIEIFNTAGSSHLLASRQRQIK